MRLVQVPWTKSHRHHSTVAGPRIHLGMTELQIRREIARADCCLCILDQHDLAVDTTAAAADRPISSPNRYKSDVLSSLMKRIHKDAEMLSVNDGATLAATVAKLRG